MYCILAQLAITACAIFFPASITSIPPLVRLLITVGVYAVTAVCVGILAARLHKTGLGVLFAFLGFIPCISLISLLIINQQATKLLTRNGIKVGLMGADLGSI